MGILTDGKTLKDGNTNHTHITDITFSFKLRCCKDTIKNPYVLNKIYVYLNVFTVQITCINGTLILSIVQMLNAINQLFSLRNV